MKASERHPSWLFLRLLYPCVGQKGAQGQVENQCPFPLALLRVALSRWFGWDERYLLYDIKEGSGEI